MTKKFIAVALVFATFAFAHRALAVSSEIHVTQDGKATVSSAKVMQIAGNTFYTRLYWGDSFVRFTVRANSSTKFLRATGEATTISEIKEGDILDINGELEARSDTMTLNASLIKNSSVQKEQASMTGTVISVDHSDARQFLLKSKERGVVTVKVATSTQFLKGTRTLDLEHLRAGDRITKLSGEYDIPTKTLTAKSVTIYIDMSVFKPRNFTGKLAEAPATTTATSIKVTINKIPYTINISDKTILMRNNKSTTTLQRFVTGDNLRLYGTLREVDEPIIDAEVVRNLSL